jgi:hypothetical protein
MSYDPAKLKNVNTTPDGTTTFEWQDEESAKAFYDFLNEKMVETGCKIILTPSPSENYHFCSDDVICVEVNPDRREQVIFKNLSHGPESV